ncbi:hypothetical protein Pcinc_003261 [Petrolisthes cinctipes]|uniref:Ionotropic glutamate receptor C-terminal domain-containing protein n=1 Tax=Petrolisthes cinctipes TaxID=88211 RepID=A0AAE1GJ77_PETCI|nr:hypothetical protein Pcinc_003261 [Petrolisthes cinctipes]
MILGAWVLLGMMITLSYSCNLTSLLAVRRIPHPVQTLRDLLDNPSLTVIMSPNSIITATIARSQEGDLHDLHGLQETGRVKFMPPSFLPKALQTLVVRGDHVIISTTLRMANLISQTFSETGECDFYISRQTFISNTHSIITQKSSPLTPAISNWVTRVLEAGIFNHWTASSLRNYTNCRQSSSKITILSAISMKSILGIIGMLGLGLIAAIAVFCLELFVTRFNCATFDERPLHT